MTRTLRDEFAMNAINGILSNTAAFDGNAISCMKNHEGFSSIIFLAYYIADQMIIERDAKREAE